MEPREKIWIAALAIAILGLAFMAGQLFFYNRQGRVIIPAPFATGGLGANLPASVKEGLTLAFGEKKFSVKPQELETWIESYFRSFFGGQEYRINQEKIRAYLESISKEINTPPVNARFSISNGTITEFTPSQNGRLLNIPESLQFVVSTLRSGPPPAGKSVELVVDEIEPELTLDKVNNLGISVLLGRGESDFAGSSNARIKNIGVGSKIFNGVLLKPGQEFSFNRLLGPVGAFGGYLPELVIKKGALIPEYGGGLCQVSTTLFRAAMAAGLAILERHSHSIPVHYYNPQGFDATIYPGVSDLRFKNDAPAYVLIQSKVAGSKLYFEIYGANDGRKVTIDGPHQYDIKSNGALKAVLTRTIAYADGTEKKDVFYSSYSSNRAFSTVRNPLE